MFASKKHFRDLLKKLGYGIDSEGELYDNSEWPQEAVSTTEFYDLKQKVDALYAHFGLDLERERRVRSHK